VTIDTSVRSLAEPLQRDLRARQFELEVQVDAEPGHLSQRSRVRHSAHAAQRRWQQL